MSTRATYLGAAGCITDGAVRDVKRIREMGFPVFAAAANPVDTKFRGTMVMYDVPAEFSTVRVKSGDLVFGDEDGIAVVPSEQIEIVLTKAIDKVRAEDTVRGVNLGGWP